MVSTTDPQMPHGRKSMSRLFDRHKMDEHLLRPDRVRRTRPPRTRCLACLLTTT